MSFARQATLAKLPRIIRRPMMRMTLGMFGRERAKSFGTFTVSSIAGQSSYNRFHPTVVTSSLTYGPIEDDGSCLATLICDHRVIDGYRAAVCLEHLQEVMRKEISEELRELSALQCFTDTGRAAA